MLKKSSGIAIVFVLLVVGAFYYDRYQKDHQFEKGGEFAQFLATEAVRDAKENNHVLLDYTPESIRIVESILGSVHDREESFRFRFGRTVWSCGSCCGQ